MDSPKAAMWQIPRFNYILGEIVMVVHWTTKLRILYSTWCKIVSLNKGWTIRNLEYPYQYLGSLTLVDEPFTIKVPGWTGIEAMRSSLRLTPVPRYW